MTRYISMKDGNVLIRKALKEAFPGIKFSVRGSSYSMGASTTVSWVDGPSDKAVKEITDQFEGTSFDGMIDLASPKAQLLNGEVVHYATDYVFTRREISADAEAEAKALLEAEGIDCSDPSRRYYKIPQVAYDLGYYGYEGNNIAQWIQFVAHLNLDARFAAEGALA